MTATPLIDQLLAEDGERDLYWRRTIRREVRALRAERDALRAQLVERVVEVAHLRPLDKLVVLIDDTDPDNDYLDEVLTGLEERLGAEGRITVVAGIESATVIEGPESGDSGGS